MEKRQRVVFIACSGLGRINRGYESFTRECFNNLKHSEEFDMFLLKGGGNSVDKEITVGNLSRGGKLAGLFSKLIGKNRYYIEQLTFCLALIPILIKKRPSLIYFSHFQLGTFLWQLRRFSGFKYKLLFSNGAPNGPPFTRTDYVQQLLPLYMEQAKAGGTHEKVQTLLPYAIDFSAEENLTKLKTHKEIRMCLELPLDKKIIISVGAVNSHHKRMDYVVKEFASIQKNDFFLVILGQIDEASSKIIELAEQKLDRETYLIRQVKNEQVKEYLLAADYFVLASLHEGLPRVLLEALSAGLMPIVHDYAVTRETLKEYGIYKNLQEPNGLLAGLKESEQKKMPKRDLIYYCWDNYSWQKLKSQYVKMIESSL